MLTLDQARIIADATIAEGKKLGLAPLAVSVLDRGGNLLVFQRQEDAGILRFDITFAKAWGSLGMGFSSRELAKRANNAPAFFNALAAASGGRVAPSPGGVLIADSGGRVIGAVGVSGDVGDMDEKCALAGIAAAGLRAVE
jgi:uncharacterized protein GlcG (DUF336 family)